MDENTEKTFWQLVCESIFIKSPDWYGLVGTLADKLDPDVCLKHTVAPQTLTSASIRAQGWVGHGIKEEYKPSPVKSPLSQLQWAYMQFSCQFFMMEGLYNYLVINGMSDPGSWNITVTTHLIEIAQTMSFYSAMLIICEEHRLPDHEADLVPLIREEIQKIVGVLTSKTTDYGQAFLRHGVVGLLYRVWDKVARYATLSAENRPAKFESRRDTATDMLGYSVLIWSILEDMQANQNSLAVEVSEFHTDHGTEYP